MDKYLLVQFNEGEEVMSELTPITGRELLIIGPAISEISKIPVEPFEDAYDTYGHIKGFEKLIEFLPDGEDSIYRVTDIKVLMVTDILM